VVTGIFGGVIGSVVLAIAADLFAPQLRGRVMGVIQTAFAASQVLGLPLGLYLSNRWNWHAPFIAMAIFGAVGGLVIAWRMRPVADHLLIPQEKTAFMHLWHTVTEPRYLTAFATTALLTTGGFMLMPFSSAFTVNNLGIALERLPTIYLVTGICTIFVGPLVGKAADAWGKLPVFLAGSALTITMVLIYTHLGPLPFWLLIVVNVVMFVGIFSRMIPFQALVSSVPEPTQRGSFNAISAATQQLAGGLSSLAAGHIVSFGADGKLQHFTLVGYVVVASTLVAASMAWRVNRGVQLRAAAQTPTPVAA
jgi:predicted MFS family arabinose efflux permease